MDSNVDRPVRKPELQELTGLSDTTIWRLEREGNFPRRFRIYGRLVGWRRSEIMFWLEQRMGGADRPALVGVKEPRPTAPQDAQPDT